MTWVKICGITTLEDAYHAVRFGADAIGLNFYRSSARCVDLKVAQKICQNLPKHIVRVGVFVNEVDALVQEILQTCPLDYLQFHGDEPFSYCQKFVGHFFKAFRVENPSDLKKIPSYLSLQGEDRLFLLDSRKEGQYGGTGISFDWRLALKARPFGQLILSGGLKAENVRKALSKVKPYGVDVSSGVESDPKKNPGEKDPELIRKFIHAVRLWDNRSEPSPVTPPNSAPKGSAKKVRKERNKVAEKSSGRFGQMGGAYVPETLIPALEQLDQAFIEMKKDEKFWQEFRKLLRTYVGRPTPLYYAKRLSEAMDCGKIFLKREDLCHTGAHKINNALGQGLLACRMGKKRVIAETGAGQHGVATATAAALLNLSCDIFMGEEDIQRQAPNVERMKILGANVICVSSGAKTLKDALNEALRDWVTHIRNTHYILGSVAGPHPYPTLVREFQSVIGREVHRQILKRVGRLPDFLVACVGGGSNAMGLFSEFLDYRKIVLIGVEAGGEGLHTGRHAASLTEGKLGVLHGSQSYVLQDSFGQIREAHSISAGLDYPGVGPELAYLKETERLRVETITDKEAIEGFEILARTEGIIAALETSHAIAYLKKMKGKADQIVVVNLSGRGDKDLSSYLKYKEGGV